MVAPNILVFLHGPITVSLFIFKRVRLCISHTRIWNNFIQTRQRCYFSMVRRMQRELLEHFWNTLGTLFALNLDKTFNSYCM